jgi:hypothetical protein
VRARSLVECTDQPVTQPVGVEASSDHTSAEVATRAGRRFEHQRASRHRRRETRTGKVVGEQCRVEVLEPLESDEHESASGAKVAAGHGARHER